jgi:glycosyltransferase involved in cell wall biosynthesis
MLFARDYLTDQIILGATTTFTPCVSVVLPTFRRRDSLARAINSVLTQTFGDLELLVLDDGSTDGSNELIEQIRARDPRVIHVRHERNSGIHSIRLNEGIELARGRFVIFQFDDDLWLPDALRALVTEADRHREPVIVVGRSRITGKAREWILPTVQLDLVTLLEQNRVGNNSVLVPRELFEQFGMYDCHIGMRRLCDWDLWLRLIRYVPFVVVDEIISHVFESNPGSLGLTVPWDLALFRFLHDIPRNDLLTPARWRDYAIDSLRVGAVEIPNDIRRRLYEEQIVPYYFKFRHHFPALEGFQATLTRADCKTVLLAKNSYDVSNDVTLGHYDALTHPRGNYKAFYQPLAQITPNWVNDADALLLVRTVEDAAADLLDLAAGAQKPIGFYLDDDLLHFAEYGAQFDYLAPGTPYHSNLSEYITRADTVWVTNSFLRESVGSLNPRVIRHNNSIPRDALPIDIRPRDPSAPIRIGYAGSGYRIEEFAAIWDGLVRLSREWGEKLVFEFWGLDVSELPRLASPVIHKPFTFSYPGYLNQLRDARFDILLVPLLDHPRPRLAKSQIKYYEAAVAGALGIFSNVPPYAALPENLTCLKTHNTSDAWHTAIQRALALPAREFDTMRRRALAHVRDEFTERAQIHLHEAAWRATEFHSKTRAVRDADGRPRVMYVFHSAHLGGGEIQLWRRIRIARAYGIAPIIILPRVLQKTETAQRVAESLTRENYPVEFVDYTCFDAPRLPSEFSSDLECDQIRALLERCPPALVHTVTFIPSFGQVCRERNIPHVSSQYAVSDAVAPSQNRVNFKHGEMTQSDTLYYARRWGELLSVERMCAREVVPREVFEFGQMRALERIGIAETKPSARPRLILTGTVQERKRQLETIEALGRLRRAGWDADLDIFGYTHFFPDYVAKCEEKIRAHHLQDRVHWRGFSDDVLANLRDADLMLSLSTFESFPSAIKEAMAGGVLAVATPIGGISELIIDGVSGILCADTSIEAITDGIRRALELSADARTRIVEQARQVARSEFHPDRAANDLFLMYNATVDLTRGESLSHAQTAPAARGRVIEPRQSPTQSIPLDRALVYRLAPHQDNWMGVDVLIGTHQRPASGTMVLQIHSRAGASLRESQVDLSRARDNSWLRFRFEPLSGTGNQPVFLTFELRDAGSNTRINFYDDAPSQARMYRIAQRLLRRAGLTPPRDSLHCRMWYSE